MASPTLSSRAASGAAWNVGLGVVVRVAGLLGTLALTHFIAPAQYGAVSVAAVCVVTVTRLLNLGLSAFVIANATAPALTFQAFLLQVTASAAACGVTVVFREGIASAVGVPEAARYFPGLALAGLVLQASQVPSATLVRSLRFRIVATSKALGELAFTATSVGLAPLLGATAIVAGNIARSTLVSGLLLVRSDAKEWFEPNRPQARTLGRFLTFGLPLTGVIVTDAAASQWDNLLVGRLFGPAAVGQYALAYNLAITPASAIAEPISDVLFPSFARIAPDRRKDALLRAVALLALVSFPVAFGLAAIAARLIGAILDPQWAPVGPMMALLTGVSLMRPMGWVVDAYFQAQNRTHVILGLSVFRAVAVLGSIATLGAKGPAWACVAASLAFVTHGLLSVVTLAAVEGIPVASTVGTAGRPLLAAALMAAIVFLLDGLIPPTRGHLGLLLLVAEIALGGAAYATLCSLLARDTAGDLVRLARDVVSRGWAPEPS